MELRQNTGSSTLSV